MLQLFKIRFTSQSRFCLFLLLIYLFYAPSVLARSAPTSTRQFALQPGLSAAHTGIQVISAQTGQTLISQNADVPLMPASNMKVLTSAAALSLLKPEFRFKTHLLSNGYVRGNSLQGNLYLKGYGDPVLTDERLQELIQELKLLGVTEIQGNLIADDSFFDQERVGRGWKSTYGASAYSAQISALSMNLNTVEVRVRPVQVGRAAMVNLKPENTFFEIINQTGTSSGRTRLKIARQLVNGKNQIIVSGNVNIQGRTEIETINLDNPTLYVANVAQTLLRKEGIRLQGRTQLGATPSGAVILASTESPPLREVVNHLNKDSVNLIAENLLKFMGANFEGVPGSAAKGSKVVLNRFLTGMVGLPHNPNLVIADGSGLSPLNRMTANTLARVLQYMFHQYDVSVDFMASLPISGVDGTLKKRMNTPELKRRVRAKTGFINGVSALSGYVYTQKNQVMIFSALMNHYSNMFAATSTQEKLCQQLLYTP